MRILVFSDTHGDFKKCADITDRLIGVDMILHAGDHAEDARRLSELFPDIPVHYVSGNCDFGNAPKELVIAAEDKKIFLTHGHIYNVKNEYELSSLLDRAESLECDSAVFGHTHISLCDVKRGITLLNPGSAKYGETFGVIEIENGKLKAAVCDF